jgi:hypothetical protein
MSGKLQLTIETKVQGVLIAAEDWQPKEKIFK